MLNEELSHFCIFYSDRNLHGMLEYTSLVTDNFGFVCFLGRQLILLRVFQPFSVQIFIYDTSLPCSSP